MGTGCDRARTTPDLSPVEDEYDPQGVTNRPLQSWTMTIRRGTTAGATAAAQGPIVRTLKGSAKSGAVRPRWNGKGADGRRAPDGVYTWTLTGTGPGGRLAATTGGTKPISGTVRVDSKTPTPKVSLPTTAARNAPTNGIKVSWSSSERKVRYTVKVKVGVRRNGTVQWSAAKRWRSWTTSTSGRYIGTKVPFPLRNNRLYRFTVTSTDLAGNHRSETRTVTVPKA